jgi:hypothetical protein
MKKSWFTPKKAIPRELEQIQKDYSFACGLYGAAQHRLEVTLPQEIKGLEQRVSNLQVELENHARRVAEEKAQEKVPDPAQAPNLSVVE